MQDLFDPFQEALRSSPYSTYRAYLETGAVQLGKPPMPEYPESWYVFGYPEAADVLRNPLFVRDRSTVVPEHNFVKGLPAEQQHFWGEIRKWFLLMDPPSHTIERSRVAKFFSRTSALQLDGFIDSTADTFLDSALRNGGLDLLWDYAYPLSVRVISQILGTTVPDVRWFKSCTRAIAAAFSVRNNKNAYAGAASSLSELLQFIGDSYGMQGSDQSAGSVIGHFLATSGHNDKSAFSDMIDPLLTLLLVVGQETVSDSIGNGMITLFNHPAERAKLQKEPHLVPAAVEEMLRFEPPVQYAVARTASADTYVGGVQIRRGDSLTVVLGAACRDPRRYPDPDRFDLSRTGSSDTLVFGKGIHVCLGAHLARLTLQIVFSKLLARLPAHWTIPQEPVWRDNISLRGPAELLIEF